MSKEIDKTILKDTDPMPYGLHKGTALANVPDEYLDYIYKTHDFKYYPGLKKYLNKNIEAIQKNIKK